MLKSEAYESGTAENNFRHGRWKSFYALLQDPISKEVVGAEHGA